MPVESPPQNIVIPNGRAAAVRNLLFSRKPRIPTFA
jgi:hypothetical protein